MATSLSQTPPHPSSTLVNISDDADLRLIRVLAPATSSPSDFETTCNAAIQSGDAAKLLRCVISNGAVAGLLEDEFSLDEAVSAFSLLTVYLDRVGDASVEKELCAALAESVGKIEVAADDEAATGKGRERAVELRKRFDKWFYVISDASFKQRALLSTQRFELRNAGKSSIVTGKNDKCIVT